MEKLAIFLNKSLKINLLKIKNILKLGTIAVIQRNVEVQHIAYVI